MKHITLFVSCMVALCAMAHAQDFVPFVIPTTTVTTSPMVFQQNAIKATSPRVVATGDHFTCDGKRIRFWGVNTTFSGNLPDKPVAFLIAQRLAAAGVNSVRIHHLDTSSYPRGIFSSNGTLSTDALDRLDNFVAQLAAHGIYVDLNLHVGRTHSKPLGLPDPGTNYDKIVDLFTPALIDAQKDYARKMLSRVNPYRGVSYAADPTVAIVEITNEDSVFMWSANEKLRELPPFYADLLRGQFNKWLQARYGDTAGVGKAWKTGVEPAGPDLISRGQLAGKSAWSIEQHETAKGTLKHDVYDGRPCDRLDIHQIDGTDWHLQIKHVGLKVEPRHYYTLTFSGAADATRTLPVNVSMAEAPWSNLGLARTVRLTPQWTTFTLAFTSTGGSANARVTFSPGGARETIYLADAQFFSGGQAGLLPGETLEGGTVAVFGDQESSQRIKDRLLFLAETEKHYFDMMRGFVRNDLGCPALVTGTIVFSPLNLWAQTGMDFIDGHAYWMHPSFPHRPWDPADWTIQQQGMTDHPARATLWGLAGQRLAGKPYTVTEYNHPAPNDYQAECVPMLASFAAAQDWDGVWLFDYGNDARTPDPQAIAGFFGIEQNPAKWGFMRAGAAIFRDAAIAPLPAHRTVALVSSTSTETELADHQLNIGTSLESVVHALQNLSWQDLLTHRMSVALSPGAGAATGGTPDKTLSWTSDGSHGFYLAEGPGCWVMTGHASDFSTSSGGRVAVTGPEFAAMTLTALDKKPLKSSNRVLLAACGRCENTGMKFSPDRRTVGRDWGHAPVRIEPVTGSVTLPPGKWKCSALGADGLPREEVPVSLGNGAPELKISPSHGTMWYLLERDSISGRNRAR